MQNNVRKQDLFANQLCKLLYNQNWDDYFLLLICKWKQNVKKIANKSITSLFCQLYWLI